MQAKASSMKQGGAASSKKQNGPNRQGSDGLRETGSVQERVGSTEPIQ